MIKFEKVSKYADDGLPLPSRATAGSAGYDFYVAKDTVIPPYRYQTARIEDHVYFNDIKNIKSKSSSGEYSSTLVHSPFDLKEVASLTKMLDAKPTLVPTGVKCKLPETAYLELTVRSSTPLKYWLILANSQGIIDSDYYNNPDNEGHIFFQIINLFPYAIELKKGDKIGQGILHDYFITENDTAYQKRTGGFGSTANA